MGKNIQNALRSRILVVGALKRGECELLHVCAMPYILFHTDNKSKDKWNATHLIQLHVDGE